MGHALLKGMERNFVWVGINLNHKTLVEFSLVELENEGIASQIKAA